MGLATEEKVVNNLPSTLALGNEIETNNKLFSIKSNPFWIARNFSLKHRKPVQWKIKRLMDFAGSTLGVLVLSPLFLAVAIAIKLESRGPVFFKQKRVGLYGKEFYIYKFRSMKQDAEKNLDFLKKYNETNHVMFKMFDDPRITKVGKFIRRCSIDELPQLFNVIKGEMSLVGPRPPLPHEVDMYENWHFLRFSTMSGITGKWQVSGRAEIVDFNKVVELDYKYVEEWSLLLDILILLKTIPAVLLKKGAA